MGKLDRHFDSKEGVGSFKGYLVLDGDVRQIVKNAKRVKPIPGDGKCPRSSLVCIPNRRLRDVLVSAGKKKFVNL